MWPSLISWLKLQGAWAIPLDSKVYQFKYIIGTVNKKIIQFKHIDYLGNLKGVEFKHTMCVVSEKFSVRGTKVGVSNLNIFSLSESFSVTRFHRIKRGETFSLRSSHWERFWPFLTKTDIGFSVRVSHWEVFTGKNVCLFSIWVVLTRF